MKIMTFDSAKEMMDTMKRSSEHEKELANKHPIKIEELTQGTYFMYRHEEGFDIYGIVMTKTSYPEDREIITQARANGRVYGKCFSEVCPEGEFGTTHIARVQCIISRGEFEDAVGHFGTHK